MLVWVLMLFYYSSLEELAMNGSIHHWLSTFSSWQQDICRRTDNCAIPPAADLALGIISTIGVVLSMIGLVLTIITLTIFKLVLILVYMYCYLLTPLYIRCISVIVCYTIWLHSGPCAHLTQPSFMFSCALPYLLPSRVCGRYQPNTNLWRLCGCISSDTILHSGVIYVDGSRGNSHVPKAGHCICTNHYQVHYCCVHHLLGWVDVYTKHEYRYHNLCVLFTLTWYHLLWLYFVYSCSSNSCHHSLGYWYWFHGHILQHRSYRTEIVGCFVIPLVLLFLYNFTVILPITHTSQDSDIHVP